MMEFYADKIDNEPKRHIKEIWKWKEEFNSVYSIVILESRFEML